MSDRLNRMCTRFHVRRLDLFGSAATGCGFDPDRSDLDVLVDFEPLSPVEYADAWFGLREALEQLVGRPVDLLTEAALENPHLRRRIEKERQRLFPAP
jgi:predicted nucleotidyltransferase